MANKRIINDNMMFIDSTNESTSKHQNTFWNGTSISAYHGYRYNKRTGKSEWDEVIFEDAHNIVTISGVQFAMEKLFGISGNINVPSLYSELQIGAVEDTVASKVIQTPAGTKTSPYSASDDICLFAIGLTGTGESSITKYPVNYREKSIELAKLAEDNTNLNGIIIPFRYTQQTLTAAEQKMYFGKKTVDGYNAYYLKKFDAEPTIRHIWKTDSDDETETDISASEVWDITRNTPARSYTEMILTISHKDVKEWVNVTGKIGEPIFNTISLYHGEYNQVGGDYMNVKMFSKAYIPTENLSLSKDIQFVYRTYGA